MSDAFEDCVDAAHESHMDRLVAENDALRARVAALEGEVTEYERRAGGPGLSAACLRYEIAEAKLAALEAKNVALTAHVCELIGQGHQAPCYYCAQPCNSLAGNPHEWPVALCHEDEPGVVKWHHVGCVSDRLSRLHAAESACRDIERMVEPYIAGSAFLKVVSGRARAVLAGEGEAKLRETWRGRPIQRLDDPNVDFPLPPEPEWEKDDAARAPGREGASP